MSGKRTNNHYQLEKEYQIYIILHPITREFYVHYSSATDINNVYKEHYNLRNECTKNMFRDHKYTIYPPEIYILTKTTTTSSNCYNYQLAWIKYFIEHNYNCLNIQDDILASENLFEETEIIYNSIKTRKLETIINTQSRCSLNYGRKKIPKEPDETVIINFKASSEDRELIRQNAKKNDKTMAAYLLELGLAGHVFHVEYETIKLHTKEISLLKNNINSLVKVFVNTGQATPTEVQKIISLLEEINESELKLLKMVQKEQTDRMNKIKKFLKNHCV